ncbi:DapH/DapD/GlmU-related protein [Marinifilum sp. D714]|uniref:acyltransferase n=1 Tax=Marinifilum sp. D714 TaxID=2937523 RepID=UPI0027D00631|nr:acyltransferase [Marinifilum sp. D714]MDQ2179821.1 acyltransferase [Marinifilum sp. D714]
MRLFKYIIKIYNLIFNYIQFKNKHVLISKGWIINGRICVNNMGVINIANNFRANSGLSNNPIGGDTILRLIVSNNAQLTIGKNVGISNTTIVCSQKVKIGDHVFIGGGCRIWDTDFHSIDPFIRTSGNDNDIKSSPIELKEYCFVGGGSIILKGVTVGKNSVVAAGSVVTKDIPPNQVWGGNPAKLIRNI